MIWGVILLVLVAAPFAYVMWWINQPPSRRYRTMPPVERGRGAGLRAWFRGEKPRD